MNQQLQQSTVMVKFCWKNAFDGDPDGGALLARLKAEFSRGTNITIEASKLRQWAVDESYSLGTRSLAAQLYARAGGPLVLSNTVPFALLCGTILECDHSRLRQLCEWVCGETFVGEVYLCRCIVTALQRLIKKKVPDDIPLLCLSKCLNVLFRNLLWRCVTAYEVRAIESLLPLQRLYGDTASKQFELFSSFPATVKQKYAFLSFVIPALSVYELQNFEPLLCDQLWLSQRTQPSASATADCALAWALNSLKLSNSLFSSFLIDCLSSFRKVRRLSCCRFWISRFATHNELLPLLKSLKDELANRIESHQELPLCPAEMRELTCIDYEWRWEEDEEVWCRNDCFTYAWLSVFSALCRRGWERTRPEQHCKEIIEEDEEILGCCLMNSQPAVRLEAFYACARLLSHSSDDLENSDFRKRILKSVNRFMVDNLNTDDPCLRREIFRLLRPHWMASSLSEAMWSGIDERMNSQRIFTSLSIMKIGGFWPNNAVAHIFPFVLHEDAEIRQKAIELLWEKHLDNELIDTLEGHLFVSLYDLRKMEQIGDFCRLLSKYRPVETTLKRVLAENNFHIPGVLKCVQALLDLQHELCKQYSYLIDRCVEYNEKMMCLSGSTKPGMCSSLVELSSRLDRRSAKHLLLIDAEHTQNLNEYYYTLCANSELLTLFCKFGHLSWELAEKAYASVWNVLMRSRHKGVVDNCAECFKQMTLTFIGDERYSSLPSIFLEKTKQLFVNEHVTTRNLAFCRIFSIWASRSDCNQCTFSLIAFLIATCDPFKRPVAVRALKALKLILNSATTDLITFYPAIFNMLLRTFRNGECTVRSAASHCFAVLVNCIFDEGNYGYPLYTFLTIHSEIWDLIKKEIFELNMHDVCLVLILSVLEKLHIVNSSLYTSAQLNDIAVVSAQLVKILLSSTNIRIGRTLVNCLVNLCPRPINLHAKLRAFLLRKDISTNLRYAVEYAVDKTEEEQHRRNMPKFDGTLEDTLKMGNGRIIAEAMDVTREIEQGQNDGQSKRRLYSLLENASIDTVSSHQLKRLCAAHVLVIVVPYILRCSSTFRIRYFCCVCALLMDEIERVRCITSRVCLTWLQPHSKLSSISSIVAIQRLIEEICKEESADGLLIAWREWAAETRAKRCIYNRYFEDLFVENCLAAACQKFLN